MEEKWMGHTVLGGFAPLYAARFTLISDGDLGANAQGLLRWWSAQQSEVAKNTGRDVETSFDQGGDGSWSMVHTRLAASRAVLERVQVDARPGASGPMVSVQTSYAAAPGRIVAPRDVPPLIAPDFVSSLIATDENFKDVTWHAECGGVKLSAKAHRMTSGQLQEVSDLILAPARIVPVAVVSSRDDGSWPFDTTAFAREVAGAAAVYLLDRSDEHVAGALEVLSPAMPAAVQPGLATVFAPGVLEARPVTVNPPRGSSGLAERRTLCAAVAGFARDLADEVDLSGGLEGSFFPESVAEVVR